MQTRGKTNTRMGTGQGVSTDKERVRHILLVVDRCGAGEAVRVMPYVTIVRELYPDAHITLLVNDDAAAVFAPGEVFDQVVISRLLYHIPRSHLGRRFSQAREFFRLVRQLGFGYDLVITYYSGHKLLRLLGYVVGSAGHADTVGYSEQSTRLLSRQLGPFDWNTTDPLQHIALVRTIGCTLDEPIAPCLSYTHDDSALIARRLLEHGLRNPNRLIVLHPGADWACQQWLQRRWAELADELVICYSADIVFTGSNSEIDYIEDIQRYMHAPSVSLAGQTTLPQMADLLTRSCLCICVDSAIFELTQATGTPAVVLAGPTRPETVVPGKRPPLLVKRMGMQLADTITRCKDSGDRKALGGCLNYQCSMAGLREISVADVLEAVERQAQTAGLRTCEQYNA
jgi:ADP-heptose:LPS heptosyltransferase